MPSPKDLRGAASVARTLAYVVGLVGVVFGVAVQRGGNTPLALAIWVITFAAGAVLMIAGFLCEGIAALLARTAALEQQVASLRGPAPRTGSDDWSADHPNPW